MNNESTASMTYVPLREQYFVSNSLLALSRNHSLNSFGDIGGVVNNTPVPFYQKPIASNIAATTTDYFALNPAAHTLKSRNLAYLIGTGEKSMYDFDFCRDSYRLTDKTARDFNLFVGSSSSTGHGGFSSSSTSSSGSYSGSSSSSGGSSGGK